VPSARVRTCVRRVSIKGRPGSWLRRALESGSLATAISEASDLPSLNLSDALAIVLLMAEQAHPSFDRAGARWVARLGLEHRLGLEELRVAMEAVSALPHHPAHARSCLADVCARHGLADVIGLPDRPPTPQHGRPG
jgi:hypothetical protein